MRVYVRHMVYSRKKKKSRQKKKAKPKKIHQEIERYTVGEAMKRALLN